MDIRPATPDDRAAVANVVDASLLEVDDDILTDALDSDDVLVAVEESSRPVLGALVLDGDRIAAVAVRRRRRGQGIGTALVEAASERRDRLVAEFDERVRPFWETLGFDIEAIGEDRYRGTETTDHT